MLLHESSMHYLGYIIIAVALILAIGVLIDSQKRQMEDSTKWFLIVLFFNIIGLIVYLTQRPKIEKTIKDD